jgi:isoleucyl-tRNA synthetase
MIPVPEKGFIEKFESVKGLIQSEVNVKEIKFITDTESILVKRIKPDFKKLGPKYGKKMKDITGRIAGMSNQDIHRFERDGEFELDLGDERISISIDDVEIVSEDLPGWLVANEGKLTVALDINITDELKYEGIAREFINRIQNIRKESGFDVTDKIMIEICKHDAINEAIIRYSDYIGSQTLADKINLVDNLNGDSREIEIDEDIRTLIKIVRIS